MPPAYVLVRDRGSDGVAENGMGEIGAEETSDAA